MGSAPDPLTTISETFRAVGLVKSTRFRRSGGIVRLPTATSPRPSSGYDIIASRATGRPPTCTRMCPVWSVLLRAAWAGWLTWLARPDPGSPTSNEQAVVLPGVRRVRAADDLPDGAQGVFHDRTWRLRRVPLVPSPSSANG